MHLVSPSAVRHRLRTIGVLGLLLVATPTPTSTSAEGPPDAGAESTPLVVELEQPDGTMLSGRLVRIDGSEVTLGVSGETRALPLDRVRRLGRTARAAEQGRPLLLTCADGSTLTGDDFSWDGGRAVLARPEGPVELPIGRIRSIAWIAAGDAPAGPRWLASIPESTGSDLVVVRGSKAGGDRPADAAADAPVAADGDATPWEFVECAIASVSADRVMVVLDGETIPVKRSKILGLHWLREAVAPAGGVQIDVDGGSLRAGSVSWSPQGLVLDGDVRMPAAMLAGIDYAAGRRVSLESLPTERLDVEPWFGGLGTVDGLAEFFSPRPVAADGQWPRPGLVMRPRTVAVWRLPADARRFRAVVSPAAGRQAAGAASVAVALDDREVFRRRIDAEAVERMPADTAGDPGRRPSDGEQATTPGMPVDLDVAGVRRLTVTVDFCGPGETNAAIRFSEPVIEK